MLRTILTGPFSGSKRAITPVNALEEAHTLAVYDAEWARLHPKIANASAYLNREDDYDRWLEAEIFNYR